MRDRESMGGGAGARKGFPYVSVIVILLCVIALLLLAREGMRIRRSYLAYRGEAARALAVRDTYLPGVFVDGVDLSGMTRGEAGALFADRQNEKQSDFTLIIRADGKQWRVTNREVPMAFHVDEVLDAAFLPGHRGTLSRRLAEIDALAAEPVHYETSYAYDRTAAEGLAERIAAAVDTAPADAAPDAFDPDTKTFTFRREKAGKRLDQARLTADILDALDREDFSKPVEGVMETVPPSITAADLTGRFGLISSFTTETTADRDRNTNIRISAEALNGRVVPPGETLSFNGCTGRRTGEKGYREAGAIAGGVLVDDTGGGVCQTSSTLFNAVVRADLEIVKRYAHSWPSSYVPKGEDATVNWPSRDFVFRNSSPYAVFLMAWYEDRHVTVEVYGHLPDGFASIDLASTTVKTTKPPPGTLYTLDETLPLGTRQAGRSRHTGYLVDTYKVYYAADGQEIRREKLWTTDYPASQDEILYH